MCAMLAETKKLTRDHSVVVSDIIQECIAQPVFLCLPFTVTRSRRKIAFDIASETINRRADLVRVSVGKQKDET